MAMLKTLVRKNGGCKQIKNYLERDGRSLAFDCDGSVTFENWAVEFDAQRRCHDPKDAGRKYYHFIISPDPDDGCDLDMLRELATAWVDARYPDGQWVIEYHDDNGIVHAHVVLNSVMPSDGRKVHIDNESTRKDALVLQDLCRNLGLSSFGSGRIERDEDGWTVEPARSGNAKSRESAPRVSRTSAESAIRKKGGWVWKDDVRDAIDSALVGARTWDDFKRNMEGLGYGCARTGRGVTFTHPTPFDGGAARKVRGTVSNLGSDYTVPGIMARLQPNLEHVYNGMASIPRDGIVLPARSWPQMIERRGRRRPWVAPQDVADLMAITRLNGFSSYSQIESRLAALKAEAAEIGREAAEVDARAKMAVEAIDMALEMRALASLEGDDDGIGLEDAHRIVEISEWLSARGIDVDDAVASAERAAMRARSAAEVVRRRSEEIHAEVDGLKKAVKTMEAIGVPREQASGRAVNSVMAIDGGSHEISVQAVKFEKFGETCDFLGHSGYGSLAAWAHMCREADLREQMAGVRSPLVPIDEAGVARRTPRRSGHQLNASGGGGIATEMVASRQATDRQINAINTLHGMGVISDDEMADFRRRPDLGAARALLNAHPEAICEMPDLRPGTKKN